MLTGSTTAPFRWKQSPPSRYGMYCNTGVVPKALKSPLPWDGPAVFSCKITFLPPAAADIYNTHICIFGAWGFLTGSKSKGSVGIVQKNSSHGTRHTDKAAKNEGCKIDPKSTDRQQMWLESILTPLLSALSQKETFFFPYNHDQVLWYHSVRQSSLFIGARLGVEEKVFARLQPPP